MPFRLLELPGCPALLIFHRLKNAQGILIVLLAAIRDFDPPGCPNQQLRPNIIFQLANLAAHGGKRQSECPRRRGKSTLINHLDEHTHCL